MTSYRSITMSLYRPDLRLLDLVAKFAGVNLRQTRCVLRHWRDRPTWAVRLPYEHKEVLATLHGVPVTQSSKVEEAVLRLREYYVKDGGAFPRILFKHSDEESVPTPEQVVACHQEYQEIVRASGR